MSAQSPVVHLDVGGCKYSIFADDIYKHPGSLFEQIANDKGGTSSTSVDRDGSLFKYVNAFLVSGSLPRDRQGVLSIDNSLIAKLSAEAEFYRLPALQAECDALVSSMSSYLSVRRLIQTMSAGKQLENALDVEYKDSESPLTKAIHSALAPACATEQKQVKHVKLLKADKWTLKELYKCAKADNPHMQKSDSFEIDAAKLDTASCESIMQHHGAYPARSGFAGISIKYHLVKLCVDTVSAPARTRAGAETVDLPNQKGGRIGTLILVMNNDYEGGEVCICSDGKQEEKVPRRQNTIAVHADCTYRMDRVTSGTRVSLIYDIIGTAHKKEQKPVSELDQYNFSSVNENPRDRIWYRNWMYGQAQVLFRTTIPLEAGQKVLCEVSEELKTDDFLFIALQYVYPENAKSQAHLRGGDRALYDLLCETYNVQVVSTIVQHQRSGMDSEKFDRLQAALFTPSIIAELTSSTIEKSNRRKRRMILAKMFLPHTLVVNNVMHYVEGTEEGQQHHDSVYLVSALQVTKREKLSK